MTTKDDRESGNKGQWFLLMDFLVRVPLLFKSVAAGITAAITLAALAFAAAAFFDIDGVGVYVAPAKLVLPVMGRIIPSAWLHVLIPGGCAPAGVLLILVSAVLPWTLFFGAIYFAWAASKRRRAANTGVSPG